MELTIGVSVGSSIQIAAGMIPLLVIIAWPMNKDLTLFFVCSPTRPFHPTVHFGRYPAAVSPAYTAD
jgi:hypothetical protein